MWLSWKRNDKLFIAHASLGATTEAAWQTWEITPPERCKVIEHRLASSGAGAVGVADEVFHPSQSTTGYGAHYSLHFHWLLPTGLGEDVALFRPSTQTEAAQFTSLPHSTMNLIIGPDGVAHFFIVGKKRGERPANQERVYYSRITGGAVLASEPSVQGGSQQAAITEGPRRLH